MASRARWSLVIAALAGCTTTPSPASPGPSASPPAASVPPPADHFALPPERPATTPLRAVYAGPARLRAGSNEEIRVTIENVGGKPETLSLFVLAVPQLAIEVFDAQARVVPPMSPPVPPAQMDTVQLAPGATRAVSLPLQAFSPPLAPGRYSARLRDERVHGAPFVFVVE
jgi:hypothetical protein